MNKPKRKLTNIRTHEVSCVDKGANDQEFLIYKRNIETNNDLGKGGEKMEKDTEGEIIEAIPDNRKVDLLKNINDKLNEVKNADVKKEVEKVAGELGVDTTNKSAMEKVEKLVADKPIGNTTNTDRETFATKDNEIVKNLQAESDKISKKSETQDTTKPIVIDKDAGIAELTKTVEVLINKINDLEAQIPIRKGYVANPESREMETAIQKAKDAIAMWGSNENVAKMRENHISPMEDLRANLKSCDARLQH